MCKNYQLSLAHFPFDILIRLTFAGTSIMAFIFFLATLWLSFSQHCLGLSFFLLSTFICTPNEPFGFLVLSFHPFIPMGIVFPFDLLCVLGSLCFLQAHFPVILTFLFLCFSLVKLIYLPLIVFIFISTTLFIYLNVEVVAIRVFFTYQ